MSKRWIDEMRERHRADYTVESELAATLRETPAAERGKAYRTTHEELFRQLPDHPHLTVGQDEQTRASAQRLRFIKSLGFGRRSTLLDIGAGNGNFCVTAAPFFDRVFGGDFSGSIKDVDGKASNLETFVLEGPMLPLDNGSVDIAYSDQFIQMLHPDDVAAHLREVRRVVRPSGRYVCVTANRASGPHDISVFFDDIARGVHLREYTSTEMATMLRAAGFERVRFYLGGRGRYFPVPVAVISVVERLVSSIPRAIRSRLTESSMVANLYPVLGINAVADNIGT